MKQTLYLLLLILLLPLSALADGMSVESFRRLDTDMDARINYPEKDPTGRTCAIIKVVNPNTGFVFDTGTVAVIKTHQGTGEIWVYVQPGVKKFIVNHPTLGVMRDYYFPMAIEEATVYELRLTTGTVHTYVEKKSTTAYLIINSVPAGADVYIGGEWVSQTPFNKKYSLGDRLQYRVSRPLYHDEVGEVTLDKAKTEVNAELKPAYGAIQINSQPSGATVMLDNDPHPRGTTPLTINEVASGAHRVRVQMPRYGQQVIDVTVTDGGTVTADARLTASFASLTVNSLPGATIKADGSVKGTGTATWEQDAGLCDVEVSLNGHRSQSRQIEVQAGQPQTLTLEPVPMYGILAVESDPMGADIYIDGEKRGVTPDVFDRLLAVDHTVRLSMAGCADYTTTVTVKEGEEMTVSGKLPTVTARTEDRQRPSGSQSFKDSKEFTVNGVTFRMIPVKGGKFTMGATGNIAKGSYSDEKPTHKVTLSDYMIGETEVTQALWEAVMGENPSMFKGANLPVEQVSWDDCQKFIQRLNQLTGMNFRLPTEAEWEYAAKGGKKAHGYLFSGSDGIDSVAWFEYNSGGITNPVATMEPNELGIYDMSGNVCEWCSDWYDKYQSSSQTNPTGPASGSYRVGRGGGWDESPLACRPFLRDYHSPSFRSDNLGFRLVLIP